MRSKNNFLSLLIATAVFLAPINLFLKWGESHAYVGGVFTDYLVGKFWIGEIPVLLALLLWLPEKIRASFKKIQPFLKKNVLLLGMLVLLAVRQFFSPLPIISVWYFIKLIELGLFAWCVADTWAHLNQKLFQWAVLLTIVFQVVIGSAQFFRQQALFDYHVLGETQLTGSINIARGIFQTGEKVLPYGTTAHPNILAGTVALLGIAWLRLRTRSQSSFSWKELAVIALISWILFLTQSYTAIAAFVLFLLMQNFTLIKKYAVPLAVTFFLLSPLSLLIMPTQWVTESLSRRVFLNTYAATIIFEHPLLGTGLSVFTTTLKNISSQTMNEFARFVQPVHNIFLLWLAETGLLGLAFGWALVKKLMVKQDLSWLLIVAPILSFDHYLLTQWAGGILLILFLVL